MLLHVGDGCFLHKLEASVPDVRGPGMVSKPFYPSDWLIKQKQSFLSPERDWLFHFWASGSTFWGYTDRSRSLLKDIKQVA